MMKEVDINSLSQEISLQDMFPASKRFPLSSGVSQEFTLSDFEELDRRVKEIRKNFQKLNYYLQEVKKVDERSSLY